MAKITELTAAISDWYISRGYITSRAFLTEQDLSQGNYASWCWRGNYVISASTATPPRMLKMVFPGLEGKVLNLRDIEQGMEQINRLRSNPVQIEIVPDSEPGYSGVNLTATPEFPLSASVSLDNSGQKSTGENQLNGSLGGNNLLGVADKWFVSGGRSSDFATGYDAQSFPRPGSASPGATACWITATHTGATTAPPSSIWATRGFPPVTRRPTA